MSRISGTVSRWTRITVSATVVALAALGVASSGASASQTWSSGTQLSTAGGQPITALACDSDGTTCTAVDQDGRELTFDPASPDNPTAYVLGFGNPLGGIACNSGWTLCFATDRGGNLITFDPTSPPSNEQFYPVDESGGGLQGLSCDPTFATCVAVDNFGNEVSMPTNNLMNRSVQRIDAANLQGVACPTDSLCVAIDGSGDVVTFDPASPGSPTAYALGMASTPSAITCVSTSECTAVDFNGDQLTFNPNGGASAPSTISSSTPNEGNGGLGAVSCPASDQCTAAGGGDQVTFDPETGSVVTHGGPNGIDSGGGGINAVVCASVSTCTVVDNSGGELTFSPTPASGSGVTVNDLIDGPGQLTGLSCAFSTQCTAVDAAGEEVTFDPSSPGSPLSFNHSLDTIGNGLRGVACLATSPTTPQCTAVDNNGQEVTFNPATGAIVTDGGPVSVDGNQQLAAVACSSATECTAVDNNGNEVTFDPATGSVSTNGGPISIDAGQFLAALSCPSATECVAVDNNGNEVTFDPAAGTTNSPFQVSNFGGVNGVSCPSAVQCTAVDGSGDEITFNPQSPGSDLASTQIYNFGGLTAISCPTMGYCVAITNSGGTAIEIDLASTPVSTEQDSLAGASSLRGIDCPAVTQCEAIDQVSQVFSSTLNEVTASQPADFGTQALDTAGPPATITVTNSTSATVTLDLSMTGADPNDFLLTSAATCGTSLGPDTSCTEGVRFWPSASGARTATLENTDAFSGATYPIATLSGTGGTTTQAAPTAASVTVAGSVGFTSQLKVANTHGTVTFVQDTGTASLTVSSSGAVSTTGTLAADTYTATGTTSDTAGETGAFTFTLTVTATNLAQVAPTSASTTVAHSASFTQQVNVTGGTGAVSFSTLAASGGLRISSSGLVSTIGTLHAGNLVIVGTTSDLYGDTGTFEFRLTVAGGAITQTAATSGSTTIAGSTKYSATLHTSGNVGPATFLKRAGSVQLKVSSAGKVTTTGKLAAGTYSVTGVTYDAYGDAGTFRYTLTVRS